MHCENGGKIGVIVTFSLVVVRVRKGGDSASGICISFPALNVIWMDQAGIQASYITTTVRRSMCKSNI